MGKLHIQIGTKAETRYIAIQPPLTSDQADRLRDASYIDSAVPSNFKHISPEQGEPYSETAMLTEADGSPRVTDASLLPTAEKLARLLSHYDDRVIVDGRVRFIGPDQHFFDEQQAQLLVEG